MKQYCDRGSALSVQNISTTTASWLSATRGLGRLVLATLIWTGAPASSALALTTWAQSYGNVALTNDISNDPYVQGFDYTNGIAAMPDGGAVVVGVLGQPRGQQNFFSSKSVLIRYAVDGAILWQKDLWNVESDAQDFVTADAQGNVYFASGSPGPGFAYPFVAKFDSNGSLIWFKNVKVPGPPVTDGNGIVRTNYINTPFTGMSLTADGSSLLLGASVTGQNTNDDINGVTIPAIITVNASNGGANCLALNSTLSRDTRYTSAAFAVALSTTTGRYAFLTGSPDGSKELVLVDSGGNTIATKETVGFDPLTRMIPTTDGGFLVVQRSGGANPFTALRKFGADLSLQFQKVSFSFQAESVAQTPDGGYLLCAQGTIDSLVYPPAGGAGHDKVLLIKLDAQCNLVSAAALGGPKAEAHYGFMSYPTAAVLTTDGGIALATHTSSYSGDATDKPDWWVAKTSLQGRIQSFNGAMFDVTSSTSVTDANASNGFQPPQTGVGFNDPKTLAVEGPIKLDRNGNQPPAILTVSDASATVRVQASPPRIVSERSAEAVVGQHFSFHILAAFFDPGAVITYSATGLPQGFVLDSKTGVISGVPVAGSETTQPIVCSLQATDGTTATAPVPLALTIGDGVPFFTVNGVAPQPIIAITGLADTVLSFAAQEPGTLAGRSMRVQVSTDGSTWANLPNGTGGFMTYDPSSGKYVLNSTSYPLQNGVSFRAKLTADGHPDIFSNVVGLFDFTSSKPHLGQTVFNKLFRNGLNADFDFKVTESPASSGVALRVQISGSPGNESSWTDLQDGNSGAMTQDATDSTRFSLQLNQYPPANGVYFRAVASASGSVDSLSNIVGPYTLTADKPPVVVITLSPAPSSGSGTEADPFIIKEDATGFANFKILATVTNSDRFIKATSIAYDGSTLDTFTNASNGSADHKTNVLGDHVIEGLAVDDLGVTARAGTGATYVHIAPNNAAVNQNRVAGPRTAAVATSAQNDYTLIKDGGDWFDPASWSNDVNGGSGVPGAGDGAKIGSLSVRFSKDADVGSFTMNGGHLIGPGVLTIHTYGIVGSAGGSAVGFVQLFIAQTANFEMRNDTNFPFDGSINDDGTFRMHGRGGLVGTNTFTGSGVVDFGRPAVLASQPILSNKSLIRPLGALNFKQTGGKVQATGIISENSAGLVAQGGGNAIPTASLISQDGGGLVNKSGGTVVSHDGGSVVSHDGGSVISNDGGSVISNDGGSVVSHDGGSLIGPDGSTLVAQGGGNLVAQGGGNVISTNGSTNGVSFETSSLKVATASSGYTQTGGETDLTGITIIGPVTLNGGVLSGTGIIAGDLVNNSGYISPGHSSGLIAVTGNFNQGANGTVIVEAAGAEATQFDQLQVGGISTLGGKLDISTVNNYVPLPGDPFAPLGYSSVSGSFAAVSSNVQFSVNATGLVTTLDPAKPNPPAGQPLNIATRLQIQSGDNGLFAGFIITGPLGSTKKVLIRGIGPSLAQFGIAGTIPDPLLELHKPDGSVVTNDNWKQASNAGDIPNGFAPSNDLESIIYTDLPPGNYSAILRGAHGETGVGLVEVYDFASSSNAKLANIATRGFVSTGDNVMIGGFIIGGAEPAKILVRAIAPSLAAFGLQGTLQDTTLELHDSNGSVITNEGWRSTQESEIIATTIPPTDDRESAILATLVPGNYTAVVRGKNNTTGIAVVEAYSLQ